jgi:hypothetical protein
MRKMIAALQTSVDGFIEDLTENSSGRWPRTKRPGETCDGGKALKLVRTKPLKSGKVSLTYST